MPEQKAEPKTERRVFTEEFKRDAVRLASERGNVSQVARDLGLHESVLTRWRRRLAAAPERPFPGHGSPQDPELAQIRRENARLREEVEILKKGCGYLHCAPAVRYRFIQEHLGRFSLAALCRVMRVSRSGYAAWRRRSPSRRSQQEQELLVHIRAAHAQSKGTYGSPRIHRDLRDSGIACGLNRAARLMRKHQITARPRRRFTATTDSDHPLPVAPNRLAQDFRVDKPDAAWSGDITYLWTGEGWLYLAVVLDLCSRRVVGWSMRPDLDRSLVMDALRGALTQRRPAAGLICHSDRGSQYASADYRALLAGAGALCSMPPIKP